MKSIEIILANPRGFCAGVERAIEIVELALQKYGTPIYVRHEIVHNKYVVEQLKNKGVVFVQELSEVPNGAITIFSAHGVAQKIEDEAKLRTLPVIDATCPLVTKVHKEAQKSEASGRQIILIGHAGHAEVIGTSGRINSEVLLVENPSDVLRLQVKDPQKLAYVSQTTLSLDDTKEIIDALKARFPNIEGPGTKDICYATQNRQNAVKLLSSKVQLVLVIGAQNSSNSNRLRDLAENCGCKSFLINSKDDIKLDWFLDVTKIGITAGASAPELLTEQVIDFLKENFQITLLDMEGTKENVKFSLPKELL